MVEYKVTVWTEDAVPPFLLYSVNITLFGTEGQSDVTWLHRWFHSFRKGNVLTFTVSCSKDIGELEGIKLEKRSFTQWLPGKVEVESPNGKVFKFPVYHWICSDNVNFFREGKAVLDMNESNKDLGDLRKKEIQEEQTVYCWDVYKDEMPRCVKADSISSLPQDDRSTISSALMTIFNDINGFMEELQAFLSGKTTWTSFDAIEHLYKLHVTPTSEYVFQHWREDSFFGYQFLNGINPMMIRCIKECPGNFPVAEKFFKNATSFNLESEMKKGNIFLCDYKILDEVKTNTIDSKPQYLAAPLVLLHQTEGGMMPIAIQLKQNPGEDNPVFFPSDSENDWLLAKMYVRSADFNLHELNYHLLRTHLLAEVFAVSLKRNLPRVHPVYKLLVRHTRHTLQINFLARHFLISDEGVFNKSAASGGEGLPHLIGKYLSNLTYSSLCIPDDIKDRGLENVKNFYYRDDGLKLWEIMHSFVTEILNCYYKNDGVVEKDDELQNWIKEIFEQGFLSNVETGIPQKFTTVTELVKFVTMVMFTCSVQHAAVNSGQYDYYGWMPNGPSTMREPPPTKKGVVTEATILEALPDTRTTAFSMGTVWVLSIPPSDAKFLQDFEEEYFTEPGPCKEILHFQTELKKLSEKINERNKNLELKYTYLDPALLECSVDV